MFQIRYRRCGLIRFARGSKGVGLMGLHSRLSSCRAFGAAKRPFPPMSPSSNEKPETRDQKPNAISVLFEQLLTCRLEPLDDHRCRAPHHLVAKSGIFFAACAKHRAIEKDRFSSFRRACIELPLVGRQ
jgi:hypothetical protein